MLRGITLKRAIIFDFDGTLADTLPLEFHCFRQIFGKYVSEHQYHLTDGQIVAMFGPTEVEMLQQHVPAEHVSDAIEEFLALYDQLHTTYVKPYPEIDEMLRQLHSRGVKMGVFTGKGRLTYNISVHKLGFAELLPVSITGDEVTQRKPHPEGIWSALKALNVPAADAVMVGDSNGDLIAARDAGIPCVAVQWLGTPQTKHFNIQPDFQTQSVHDFLQWLERS